MLNEANKWGLPPSLKPPNEWMNKWMYDLSACDDFFTEHANITNLQKDFPNKYKKAKWIFRRKWRVKRQIILQELGIEVFGQVNVGWIIMISRFLDWEVGFLICD